MFRMAEPRDLTGLTALWQEAFGDGPWEIAEFYRSFPDCLTYVADGVTAMVHALPQRLSPDLPAAYLYAVATRADCRGRGLCRGLMAYAEEDLRRRGFSCCVLTPGEPSLFEFYGAMGYKTAFFGRPAVLDTGTPISLPAYLQRRERLLTVPHMIYDARTLDYARRLYGLTFYETPTGIAASSPDFTAELLPDMLGDEPRAMIKWLDRPAAFSHGWLGFSLA